MFGRFSLFDRLCNHLNREERAGFFAFRWFETLNDITSVVVCLLPVGVICDCGFSWTSSLLF